MRSLILFLSLLVFSFSAYAQEACDTRTNPEGCDTVSVPEPASLGLLAGGIVAVAVARRRHLNKKDSD